MNIKKIAGMLLIIIMLSAMFAVNVSATTTDPVQHIPPADMVGFADINDVVGSVGNQLRATIIIEINGNGFNSLTANSNVISWFNNLPVQFPGSAAWAARVQSAVRAGDTTMTIVLTGTPENVALHGLPVQITIPAARIRNGTDTSDPARAATDLSLSDSGVTWDIVSTVPVSFWLEESDENERQNGTLTASATVNGQNVSVTTTANNIGSGSDAATIHIAPGDLVTFTARSTNARFTSPTWTGIPAITNSTTEIDSSDMLIRKRIITAAADVSLQLGPVYTAYRILDIDLGNGYEIFQFNEDDEDETAIEKDGSTLNADDEEIEAVEMKFGDTPIIIRKEAFNADGSVVSNPGRGTITVATNWKFDKDKGANAPHTVGSTTSITSTNSSTDIKDNWYVNVPDGARNYDLAISSKNTAVAKVEVVPAIISNSYKAEMAKFEIDTDDLKPGDLIITPQGAGTTTITITARRKTGTGASIPALSEGKIEFDITVEMPKTKIEQIKDENGAIVALTATTDNVYGQPVDVTIDIIRETATRTSLAAVAGFSHNGTSWTALAIGTQTGNRATDISRMFDRSGTLYLAERLSGTRVAPGSAVWEIGTINARHKNPRLKVFYGNPYAETAEEADTNNWTVTGHDFAAEDSPDLLYATSQDGRNPDTAVNTRTGAFPFTIFPNPNPDLSENPGYDPDEQPIVKPLPRDNKVVRSSHFFKIAAIVEEAEDDEDDADLTKIAITPASKAVRVQVSSQLRPSKITVNYKKERITLRAGMAYQYLGMDEAVIMTKANRRIGIPFNDSEAENTLFNGVSAGGRVEFTYWTAANGSKPQSQSQAVLIYNYSNWRGSDTSAVRSGFNKEKRTYKLPRGYEVRAVGSTGKWGTSVKKITGEAEFEIRKRGNARYDNKGKPWLRAGTQTASEVRKLVIVFDEYSAGKDKDGEPVTKTGMVAVRIENLDAD